MRTFISHEEELFALAVTQRKIRPVLFSSGMDRSIKCWKLPLTLFLSTNSNPGDHVGSLVLSEHQYYLRKEIDDEEEKAVEIAIGRKENPVDYVEEEEEEVG